MNHESVHVLVKCQVDEYTVKIQSNVTLHCLLLCPWPALFGGYTNPLAYSIPHHVVIMGSCLSLAGSAYSVNTQYVHISFAIIVVFSQHGSREMVDIKCTGCSGVMLAPIHGFRNVVSVVVGSEEGGRDS